jgi:acetyl esterase/lipase
MRFLPARRQQFQYMDIDRRTLLGAVALIAAAGPAQAAPDTLALWPASPPGGSGPRGPEKVDARGSLTNVSAPRLEVYRPSKPNGAAVIVIAGGGYAHIEVGAEGTPTCRWLQSIGATAFELIYRLPGEGWSRDAPFQDGQRAMRLVRSLAPSYGIDAARIGLIGFSAGGHLAGMLAVSSAQTFYPPLDAVDALSARPSFCGLMYPVLSMMPPFDDTHSRREIIGKHPSEAESEAYSVERHVGKDAPPMFLAQAADDPVSPVDNSLMMFSALRTAGIPAEMHIFQTGGHGWGLGSPGSEVHAWPELFMRWAAQFSLIPPVRDDR